MKPFTRCLLLLVMATGGVSPPLARAAAPPQFDAKGVRVGLRDGPEVARSRNGAWAPVRIPVAAGDDDVPRGAYRLVVETTDGEAVPYRYGVPVPALAARGQQVVFAYTRPGSTGAAFTVTLQTADGADVQKSEPLTRDPGRKEILEPRDVLYLTAGSRLHGLKAAQAPKPDKPAAKKEGEEEPEDVPVPGFASAENVADLPDRWFGYEAADVVVLTTAGDTFVNQLLEMDRDRRDALLDWVRRGGRLVLSVGRNQQAVAKWLDRVPLFDGTLTGKATRPELPAVQQWCGAGGRAKRPPRQVEIACVRPGPGAQALVWEEPAAGDLEGRPVVVQCACGLGRVVLVAFDLDAPPFSTWDEQAAFWKKLHDEVAPHVPAGEGNPLAGGELAAQLKQDLETFEEVPVISFGWVALFLLFYIALVGPLDYFLLKKVFKRLELTWVTFPVLVLVVSVAAYATAYHVKGDDLRVNKVDLVDIDLNGPGQVYGTSWFVLFSPRVQNYTVGLEPAWGGRWHEGDADAPLPPVTAAVLDGPEPGLGGSTSLFRRPYEYAADASGLLRVPIPVWATRGFTASWRVPLRDRDDRDGPPPLRAELRLSRDGKALSGAVTNNLPAELQGAVLFFQGRWYPLGDLVPGEAREVGPLFEADVKPHALAEWFTEPTLLQPRPASAPSSGPRHDPSGLPSRRALRDLLFYGLPGGGRRPNSGLRTLDAGWRLLEQGEGPQRRHRAEAVLVARTPPRDDRAEAVTQDGVSPSRLWLDALPGGAPERPALAGYLQQETYVRVYIPIMRQ